MTLRTSLDCRALALTLGLLASCYDPPAIPREKPLTCSPAGDAAPGECPEGFQCADNGVCALEQCTAHSDCPVGLVCSERLGCSLPGEADAGAGDGATDAVRTDIVTFEAPGSPADAPPGTGDVPAGPGAVDTAFPGPSFDALGGGQ